MNRRERFQAWCDEPGSAEETYFSFFIWVCRVVAAGVFVAAIAFLVVGVLKVTG